MTKIRSVFDILLGEIEILERNPHSLSTYERGYLKGTKDTMAKILAEKGIINDQ